MILKQQRFSLLIFILLFNFSTISLAKSDELDDINKKIRFRLYSDAVKLLKPLTRQNNAQAEFILGGLYRSGKGVKKNLDKAQIYYTKSAQHGFAKAQFTLATLLSKQSSNKSSDKVLYWYQKAADQGHKAAKRQLKRLANNSTNKSVIESTSNNIFSSIRTNNYDDIEFLIKSGVSLNITDKKNRSPLQVALISQHHDISKLILKATPSKQIRLYSKHLPLHLSISNGFNDIANILINKKLNIHTKDAQGNNALFIATRHNNKKLIKKLLDQGANPLENNINSSNAVKLAATLNQSDTVSLYKQYGFANKTKSAESIENKISSFKQQINKKSSLYKNWPLINVASLLGDTKIVAYLLKQNTDVFLNDADKFNALHRAASAGQVGIVKMLVLHGYKINKTNKKNETALYLAAQQGRFKVVKYLLKKHADTTILSKNKSSPLLIALANQHFKTSGLIAKSEKNQSILKQAAFTTIKQKQTHLSIVLIKKIKDINVLDKQNRSLLWHTADKNLPKVATALMSNKSIKLNQVDQNGFTPLAQAVKKQSTKIALSLINNGAKIDALTKQKNSLLMLASINNNKYLVKKFIQKKLPLDTKNNSGETALMLAAKSGNEDTIKILIKAGANLSLRNNYDKNAYLVALDSGQKSSAELIKKHSGRLFKFFN